MSKPSPRPRLRWQEFVARFEAEKTRQQQRYCERFELWRQCPVKGCRRHRRCCGNEPYCMVWAEDNLSWRQLQQARRDIWSETPANIGAPELEARQLGPYELCSGDTTADAVVEYLRRQNHRYVYTRARREKWRSSSFSLAAERHSRPILKLRFDFGSVALDAELLPTSTADTLKVLLPITGSVVTWEEGLYFQTDIKLPLQDACTEVAAGEIAYCADPKAIAIGFGRKPMPRDEKRQLERPCNIWARALGDVRALAAVKDGTKVRVSSWLAPPLLGDAIPSRRRRQSR
jgi:uncharacterized protein